MKMSYLRRLISLSLFLATIFNSAGAWAADKDESIYVVQERAYSKRGKFEITPIFMAKTNTRFTGFIGPSLSLAYHVRENFALELTGGWAWNYYSNLVEELERFENLTPTMADLKIMTWYTTFGFQWSPFYGKLRLVPGVLGDFDFYVGAGMGIADTKEPCKSNDASCEIIDKDSPSRFSFGLQYPQNKADRFKLAGNFSVGMRIFFKSWLGVRIELRDIVYADKVDQQNETTSKINNNLAVFLGLSFLL